jgi:hypothetical protein
MYHTDAVASRYDAVQRRTKTDRNDGRVRQDLAHGFVLGAILSGSAELPRTELALADHPLVPIYLVFDAIERRITLPK